jgi:hypothetical protein
MRRIRIDDALVLDVRRAQGAGELLHDFRRDAAIGTTPQGQHRRVEARREVSRSRQVAVLADGPPIEADDAGDIRPIGCLQEAQPSAEAEADGVDPFRRPAR